MLRLTEPPKRLLAGILLGLDHDLPKELEKAYQETGTAHIIAISGLHLGLIYWLLLLLLKPLNKSARTRWLHALLVIAGLWLFSFLAGAQPSVLRSALMFSCIVVGNSLRRRSPAINSLSFWRWPSMPGASCRARP